MCVCVFWTLGSSSQDVVLWAVCTGQGVCVFILRVENKFTDAAVGSHEDVLNKLRIFFCSVEEKELKLKRKSKSTFNVHM